MHLLYNFGIHLYYLGILFASIFNKKAKLWISGRRDLFNKLNEVDFSGKWIWVHCASLGEFEQGRPLIDKIKTESPEFKILITFFSPSGYEIRKNYKHGDYVCYLPLDTSSNAKRFVNIVKPQIAIFIKYEFWHNHILSLTEQKIPIISVSSIFRSDQRFFRKGGSFFRKSLSYFDRFFVQNSESKELLNCIGIKQVEVSGDTRFDSVNNLKNNAFLFPKIKAFCGSSKILVGGSSWPEDESILMKFIERLGDWKLILAPHEIHANEIDKLKSSFEKSLITYSELEKVDDFSKYRILVIDKIGILSSVYQYGTIAHIGGGFGKGIHNILEAATWGLPMTFGPNFEKFMEAKDAISLGCAKSIQSYEDFEEVIKEWTGNRLIEVEEKASAYIMKNKGATEITYKYILQILRK